MKTTLDLPDDLMREVKLRAVKQDRKLTDQDLRPTVVRQRVKLPLVDCAHPARPEEEVTPERAAELLADQEASGADPAT